MLYKMPGRLVYYKYTNDGNIIESNSEDFDFSKVQNFTFLKRIPRKRYKEWTQPLLTGNGTVGGEEYACRTNSNYGSEYAYKAFDGNKGTNWAGADGHFGANDWIEFYSPVAIKPYSATFFNRNTSNRLFNKFKVQGSFDGTEYFDIQSFTNNVTGANASWTINIDNPMSTKFVRFIGINNGILGAGGINSNTICTAEINIKAMLSEAEVYNEKFAQAFKY